MTKQLQDDTFLLARISSFYLALLPLVPFTVNCCHLLLAVAVSHLSVLAVLSCGPDPMFRDRVYNFAFALMNPSLIAASVILGLYFVNTTVLNCIAFPKLPCNFNF